MLLMINDQAEVTGLGWLAPCTPHSLPHVADGKSYTLWVSVSCTPKAGTHSKRAFRKRVVPPGAHGSPRVLLHTPDAPGALSHLLRKGLSFLRF